MVALLTVYTAFLAVAVMAIWPSDWQREVARGAGAALAAILGVILGAKAVAAYVRHNPILIECDGCSHLIPANEPWKCPSCHNENKAPRFSFLNRCSLCKVPPRSFECPQPRCKARILLDVEQSAKLDTRPAQSLRATSLEQAEKADIENALREKKEQKRRETELWKVEKELEEEKARLKDVREKSPKERIEEDIEQKIGYDLEAYKAWHKKKEEIRDLCKDDPELCKRLEAGIDRWLEDQSL